MLTKIMPASARMDACGEPARRGPETDRTAQDGDGHGGREGEYGTGWRPIR